MPIVVIKFLSRFWQEIAMGIVVFAILGVSLYYGSKQREKGIEIGKAAAKIEYDAQLAKSKAEQEKQKAVEIQYWKQFVENNQVKEKVEYVEVEKVITKPVYVERDCIDDNGLQIINAAVSRTR